MIHGNDKDDYRHKFIIQHVILYKNLVRVDIFGMMKGVEGKFFIRIFKGGNLCAYKENYKTPFYSISILPNETELQILSMTDSSQVFEKKSKMIDFHLKTAVINVFRIMGYEDSDIIKSLKIEGSATTYLPTITKKFLKLINNI